MKKHTFVMLGIGVALLVMGLTEAFANPVQNIKKVEAPYHAAPQGVEESQYSHQVNIQYPGNKGVVTQVDKRKLEHHPDKLKNGVTILEEKLMTFAEFNKSVNNFAENPAIDDNRMVYITKMKFENVNHPEFGEVPYVIVRRIHDAETEEFLGSMATFPDGFKPHGKPVGRSDFNK